MKFNLCKGCGKKLKLKYRKFCSLRCFGKFRIKRKIMVCKCCRNIKHMTLLDKRVFCSRNCANKFRIVKRDHVNCKACNKLFLTSSIQPSQYCSKICSYHALMKRRKIVLCKICKKPMQLVKSKQYIEYCSKSCANKLSNNPMWQNGKSFESYSVEFNKTLKEAIRQRDHYKCQLCGVSQLECVQKLCIHHIDYDKNNCKPSNLISLCLSCHSETISNRNYWKTLFENKMVVNALS